VIRGVLDQQVEIRVKDFLITSDIVQRFLLGKPMTVKETQKSLNAERKVVNVSNLSID